MSSPSMPWRSCCALVIAVSACAAASPALANADDRLKGFVGATVTRDDNIFRTSGLTAPTIADTIATAIAGISLDTNVSRQQLHADVSRSETRYQRLDALNHSGSNYRLAWQGAFPNRWTTDASWSRSQSLVNYRDVQILDKNIVTAEAARFRLACAVHPDWPIHVQLGKTRDRNSATTLAGNDAETRSGEIGMQYNSPRGSQISLVARTTDGRYPRRPAGVADGSYSQNDLQALVMWKPGVKSALSLRLGQTHREQKDQPRNDFNGATGNINFVWSPTGTTAINAYMTRDLSPQDYFVAKYAVARSHGLGVNWTPTAKISVAAKVDRQSLVFGGDTGIVIPGVVIPRDTTRAASLVLTYQPLRALQVTLSIRHEERESNDPGRPYASKVATLNATLSF